MEETGPIHPETDRRGSRPDPYQALARAIVGQQLSTKAAASIWQTLLDQFDGETPQPERAARSESPSSSERRASRGQGRLPAGSGGADRGRAIRPGAPGKLSDEDITAELTEVKGIGTWTAEMFLIFHLGRPDVVSAGDLGIRKATQPPTASTTSPGPTSLSGSPRSGGRTGPSRASISGGRCRTLRPSGPPRSRIGCPAQHWERG